MTFGALNQPDKNHKERALQVLADSTLGPGRRMDALTYIAEALAYRTYHSSRPRVVCLCGSTRFRKEFEQENARLTMEGQIVLSVGFFHHGETPITDDEKEKLDELHKRKIDLADYVYVIDVNGYIGVSTRSEINYALNHSKPVRYRSHRYTAPAFILDSKPVEPMSDTMTGDKRL